MSNFKIGEKVVCVDDSIGLTTGTKTLIKGEIYTIYEIIGNWLYLEELETIIFNGKKTLVRYSSHRFRKLDHQFADKICAEIIESLKVEVEQLN